LGKADVLWEETDASTMGDTAEQGHSSRESYAEITSGETIYQQGLTATCKDLPV
jgi:hypothetical protein